MSNKPISEIQIRELLADLLPVLEFIHSHNVIHRDIKPENIIRRASDGKPVLIDFGGAKQVTQTSLARPCYSNLYNRLCPNRTNGWICLSCQ